MPTTIGKKLRSRKVKYACERRQNLLAETGNPMRASNEPVNQFSKSDENQMRPLMGYQKQNEPYNQASSNQGQTSSKGNMCKPAFGDGNTANVGENQAFPGAYDTVTSVHDIEQDDHIYYAEKKETTQQPLLNYERKLGKILEVPSKNITRNNSVTDVGEYTNSKV